MDHFLNKTFGKIKNWPFHFTKIISCWDQEIKDWLEINKENKMYLVSSDCPSPSVGFGRGRPDPVLDRPHPVLNLISDEVPLAVQRHPIFRHVWKQNSILERNWTTNHWPKWSFKLVHFNPFKSFLIISCVHDRFKTFR